jgi:hypothetical protein
VPLFGDAPLDGGVEESGPPAASCVSEPQTFHAVTAAAITSNPRRSAVNGTFERAA